MHKGKNMEQLDISWVAILKVMLAGAFTYIVLPALLVIRDLLLHYVIGRWVLTDDLNTLIMMCENDRWYLNNKYNKSLKATFGSKGSSFIIDGVNVNIEQYNEYEKGRNFHLKRMEYAESKILFRHNLIVWLTKHYEQSEGGNPIPELQKRYYETAGPSREENA